MSFTVALFSNKCKLVVEFIRSPVQQMENQFTYFSDSAKFPMKYKLKGDKQLKVKFLPLEQHMICRYVLNHDKSFEQVASGLEHEEQILI